MPRRARRVVEDVGETWKGGRPYGSGIRDALEEGRHLARAAPVRPPLAKMAELMSDPDVAAALTDPELAPIMAGMMKDGPMSRLLSLVSHRHAK